MDGLGCDSMEGANDKRNEHEDKQLPILLIQR